MPTQTEETKRSITYISIPLIPIYNYNYDRDYHSINFIGRRY